MSIVLCADDYGYNEAVNKAIRALISLEKINATSCMTTSPTWDKDARTLKPLHEKAQIGLHLNLTEGPLLTTLKAKSLNHLLIASHLRLLNKKAIKKELEAQLTAFVDAMGCAPDFIDGHQHVHHLPQIRAALLEVYAEKCNLKKLWIRVSLNNKADLKNWIIANSGAKKLKRQLDEKNIPYNHHFSGIYNLTVRKDYPALFQSFIDDVKNDGLIMCHPGLKSDDTKDPIAQARYQEYCFLKNGSF